MIADHPLVARYASELTGKLPSSCSGHHQFHEFKGAFEHSSHFMSRRHRDSSGRFAVPECDCDMPAFRGPKVEVDMDDLGVRVVAFMSYKCPHGTKNMYVAAKVSDEALRYYRGD